MTDKYESNYFGRAGNCLSQLAHCFLGGGAADVSISGKTGYKVLVKESVYWGILESVIDFAFYPIDGVNHCKNAYLVDKKEKYSVGEGLWQDVVCTLFVLVFCPAISVFSYLYLLLINLKKKLWRSK